MHHVGYGGSRRKENDYYRISLTFIIVMFESVFFILFSRTCFPLAKEQCVTLMPC
jgi:hypothetical protein